jgi:cytochrome b561
MIQRSIIMKSLCSLQYVLLYFMHYPTKKTVQVRINQTHKKLGINIWLIKQLVCIVAWQT